MAATLLTMSAQLAKVSPLSQVTFGRTTTRTTSLSVTTTTSSHGRTVRMAAAAPKGSSGPAIDKTGDKVADKIEEAQEICSGDNQSEECATAWDAVESATAEKAKSGSTDPLDEYCEENPEADECRIYKD